ncbi:MAG TPA: hypothetical protein VNR60_12520 [Croceibacterium sp.]|nr:hypothetical protein [Croceibacterium sp.]
MERNSEGMFDLAIEVSFKIGYQVANYNDAIFNENLIKAAAADAGMRAAMAEAERQLKENQLDGTIPENWRIERE